MRAIFARMTTTPGATAPLLDSDDNSSTAPTGPAPVPPKPGAHRGRLEDHILPTGMIVRLRRVTTAEYLACKQRAALDADPRTPDPGAARHTAAMNRQMLALALVAYVPGDAVDWDDLMRAQVEQQQQQHDAHHARVERAARDAGVEPPPRVPFVYVPDRAALIAHVPDTSFITTTPMALLTGVGGTKLTDLFDNIADWEALCMCAGALLAPTRDLSAIVGKARAVG